MPRRELVPYRAQRSPATAIARRDLKGEPNMELRHLRYFIAIAEEQSITRAAERLWIAQPGLSTQMRHLEAELGVKLLDRGSRGVDLTQAGLLFLERARVVLVAADKAKATGRDLETGVIGTLRVGLATGPRWRCVSEVLRRFTHQRPGVELSVIEAYGGRLWRDLRQRHLDALVAPIGHRSPDLQCLELGTEPWVVLIGTAHPLAERHHIAAHHLTGTRIAVTGHADGAAFDRTIAALLAELHVEAELVAAAPEPALRSAIAASELLGLTTAPDALPTGLVARQLDHPRSALSFQLLWRDEVPSPALAAFIDLCAAAQPPVGSRSLRGLARTVTL
jgi:DNA-binding transcriptional LysR family regulator